jgi:alginate O-acetyltransferase complex protein AlgI
MLFNSMAFCIFFPAVVVLYYLVPKRAQWALLLAASYGFYMAWEPGYVVLIWISTAVDFMAARRIGAAHSSRVKRRWLALSLSANLGLLFFFKYYNFFRDSLGAATRGLGWSIDLPFSEFLLPLGISFYTFQTLGYTIDVYRGKCEPERHLGRFALYVCFFPQLVAGPIERAGRLLPQLGLQRVFDYENVTDGLRLMAWGFFKKMVIADRLSQIVSHVYGDSANQGGGALTLATLCFAYQIYCDFSGYSDIAIGAARVLGVRLSPNFNRPYAARSIGDFWHRWHITLSTWFRDYVYISLGGNRLGSTRWALNIIAVFAISSLWHGANWKFLAWGLLHGSYLLGERALGRYWPASRQLPGALKIVLTFALTNFAWIFFCADSISHGLQIIGHLPFGWEISLDATFWLNSRHHLGLPFGELVFVAGAVLAMEVVQYAHARHPLQPWFRERSLSFRWAVYTALFWLIFLGGVFRQQDFIYFVF